MSALIHPDHYLVRMLYSRGVRLESLGLPSRDGTPGEPDPRRGWQAFADHVHLFRATPSGAWLNFVLHEVFGVDRTLTAGTAPSIYDEIREKLAAPEFRPRALFERFGIEVLATTDAAEDPLEAHRRLAESGWAGRVIPTFRPDALFHIADPGWPARLEDLEGACGYGIRDYDAFVRALEDRRTFFRSMGATATDHAVVQPRVTGTSREAAARAFAAALEGRADAEDQRRFEGWMLMEMARMSADDGMVMQLRAGALRNHDRALFDRYGPDRGGDIPVAVEFTRSLQPLLNEYGNEPRLTLVLFTLDESTYARELAPLAGHYPALRLGPPWWFHDSVEGIRRYLDRTVETAGFYNLVGFNDDARVLFSIPARHDMARRVSANWLAARVGRARPGPAGRSGADPRPRLRPAEGGVPARAWMSSRPRRPADARWNHTVRRSGEQRDPAPARAPRPRGGAGRARGPGRRESRRLPA